MNQVSKDLEDWLSENPFELTFHDAITSSWKSAKSSLTDKQIKWGTVFLSLDNPSSAEIARQLKISRAASAKMKLRILKKLLPFYRKELEAAEHDHMFHAIALKKEKNILKVPERLVKRRGQKKWLHLKAEKVPNKRVGLSFYSGYSVREIDPDELEKLNHLPKEYQTTHTASPLSVWWKQAAIKFSKQKKISYTEALKRLLKFYSAKWADSTATSKRCPFCLCLLPLGEVIPKSGMGRVTLRRKYCSDFCKTSRKRLP